MKILGILGTASGVGKSWIATALCAWLHGQGVRVAPFKAQNMSNNAWATPDGLEMARAQAIQAEACGLAPCVEMNPILLKPGGAQRAQLIVQGRARDHREARDYYRDFDPLWRIVTDTLAHWKNRCDVLVLEGAGSPVELNLLSHDLVNLRPLRHLDGKFLLVGDIDRGGIYAQLAGTWALMPPEDRSRCLGAIVNRFRGDLSLFPDPSGWLAPHAPGLPVLGTVPLREDLQPEEEDGLTAEDLDRGEGDTMAWIRFPHVANLTDCQPWWSDTGIRTRWTTEPAVLAQAGVIVLPGTKNTLADLRWLRAHGLDRAIYAAVQRGALVVGLCGGYQMLGEALSDSAGLAGDPGDEPGLGLLPHRTLFVSEKIVQQVTVHCEGRRWTAYEIHMGRTHATSPCEPLNTVQATPSETPRGEGMQRGRVWGTYMHGWFEVPEVRRRVAMAAGFTHHRAGDATWPEIRRTRYAAMAAHLAAHLDLTPVRRHLSL